MTVHETRTALSPDEVIERARTFFALAGTPYAAFPEVVGAAYLKLHIEVGEILIGAMRQGDTTCVRGSASRGAHLLGRFLTTLGAPLGPLEKRDRYGHHETRGAIAETFAAPGHPASARAA